MKLEFFSFLQTRYTHAPTHTHMTTPHCKTQGIILTFMYLVLLHVARSYQRVEGLFLSLQSCHLKEVVRVCVCVCVYMCAVLKFQWNCTLHFAASGSLGSTGMGLMTPFDLPLTPYTRNGMILRILYCVHI